MKKTISMKIFPMSANHIPACAEIVSQSEPWKRLGDSFDFSQVLSFDPRIGAAHVLMADKEVVGFVVFSPYPVFARGGYLRAIGVAPSKRRQGFGKMLVCFAERSTVRFSPNLYLCVSSFNRKAQAFYKNLGYRRIGIIPDLLIRGASEYIYWKRLSQLKTRRS
jgi:ribosomal-protein-alanine N-acetyltransferase